jgi:hypothetical protein
LIAPKSTKNAPIFYNAAHRDAFWEAAATMNMRNVPSYRGSVKLAARRSALPRNGWPFFFAFECQALPV